MASDEKVKDTKTTAAETTKTTTSTTQTKTSEAKFKKEIFLNNSKAIGYEIYVVVGAFSNVPKDELTKSEFKQIMDDFLRKKVK